MTPTTGTDVPQRGPGLLAVHIEEPLSLSCERFVRGLKPGDPRSAPPELVEAAKDWRLLQIDSDPGLGMDWGEGGIFYVFIREADARAGDFTRTVSLRRSFDD